MSKSTLCWRHSNRRGTNSGISGWSDYREEHREEEKRMNDEEVDDTFFRGTGRLPAMNLGHIGQVETRFLK